MALSFQLSPLSLGYICLNRSLFALSHYIYTLPLFSWSSLRGHKPHGGVMDLEITLSIPPALPVHSLWKKSARLSDSSSTRPLLSQRGPLLVGQWGRGDSDHPQPHTTTTYTLFLSSGNKHTHAHPPGRTRTSTSDTHVYVNTRTSKLRVYRTHLPNLQTAAVLCVKRFPLISPCQQPGNAGEVCEKHWMSFDLILWCFCLHYCSSWTFEGIRIRFQLFLQDSVRKNAFKGNSSPQRPTSYRVSPQLVPCHTNPKDLD